ncbi:two-component system response regulator ArcA [Aliidiomarina maris]|uniref:Two-component system response regulator ArcA n=1 Tax=Aliidiomarina maris TaxID=531312 RepID=A0A327X333_9GAMM|nr:two-component system response regulator ArcA [Aliidiomarina maris]MBA3988065.1 two-component system response regulator ArcA [Idiomarina sp.]MCL5049369.1 two-component system response regulator ArcA [Bacillota bacterium]RAK00632.1 winged helix family two component transcriptional regulator [Aliidiomarina maris]RUO27357.1 two-component system response regulator ArcA [Aliidiomarina maris]
MSAKLLIVEDEVVTRQTLARLFQQEGYEVFDAADGKQMENIMAQQPVDLIIMDVNLPGQSGLELAESLREQKNIGLVFLTGRDSDEDRLLALELGADDYLIKPYNPKELTIRVRNLYRRIEHSQQPNEPKVEGSREFHFNGWVLDCDSRCLYSPDKKMFRLPKSEYRAMELFLTQPGKIHDRETLVRKMLDRELRPNDRTVDVAIRRIRRHFESHPETPNLITTIHGEGYRFVGDVRVEISQ